MIDPFGSGPIYGDWALAVLITASAGLTYLRLGFETASRWFIYSRLTMGCGLTLWAGRFWVTLTTGGDVSVAPLSQIAISMFFCGYCMVQILAIKRTRDWDAANVRCMREPEFKCQREDRIQEALLAERKK